MAEASQTASVTAGSCPTAEAAYTAPPLFQNGELTFQGMYSSLWKLFYKPNVVVRSSPCWLPLLGDAGMPD
jgi:hypothetical protein